MKCIFILIQIMTSLNLKEFYENDKQQKIQAREMIKKQIDAQKVVLSDALKSWLKPTNIQLFGWDNIVSLIEQNIYGWV